MEHRTQQETSTTAELRSTEAAAEEDQRVRLITAATLGIVGVAALLFVGYQWAGIPLLGTTIGLGIVLGLTFLLLLRLTGWTALFANLQLAVMFIILIRVAFLSGGVEGGSFAWFVVIPVLAAFVDGLRAAWVWLVLVWSAAVAFWWLDPVLLTLTDDLSFNPLQDWLGVSLALLLVTTVFIRALRRVKARLSDSNRTLGEEVDSRRRVEQALRESEESYRDLVENSPTMIYTHDLDGILLSANRALAEVLGVEDPDDLVGSDGSGFFVPANDQEVADYFHQIKMEGEASGLARVVTSTGETRLLRYHNTLRTTGLAEPLVRGLARDVTEQQRARRALLRQVEQQELVSVIATRFISLDGLDLGPAIETGLGELGSFADVDWAGLFLLSEEGDEIVATHSWKGDDDFVPEAEGRSISEFGWLAQRLRQLETVVVPDTGALEGAAASDIRALLGEDFQSALLVPLVSRHGLLGMLALVLRSRQRRWVQESLVLAHISSYVFASAVMRARHEERSLRLEKEVQQARKMESLGLVAGGIAHDFNNHLMGILGHAGFLREELTPGSDGWKALQLITDSAHRAARLTSQMLSFSGSAAIVPETVDLDDLLNVEVQRQRTALPEGVEMDLWLSGSLPPVRVDSVQIRQVVNNLILNSVEALGEGGGRVQVRSGVAHLSPETPANGFRPFERTPAQGSYAFIQVSDSGCGIESEDLTKIFDPFFSTRFKGRGLGLAAVHGIVRCSRGNHRGVQRSWLRDGRPCAAAVPGTGAGGVCRVLDPGGGSGRGRTSGCDPGCRRREVCGRCREPNARSVRIRSQDGVE